MEKHRPALKLNAQVREEAVAWFVDFSEGEVDVSGRAAFNRWLRTSPEHVRAYLQVSVFWEDAGMLNSKPDLDLQALIDRSLEEDNVVPLEPECGSGQAAVGSSASKGEGTTVRRTRRFAVAACIAVLCVGAGAIAWLEEFRFPGYATDIGEQRSFVLDDGSMVQLNSRSRLRVRFTDGERAVELLEGQALFSVAKETARPFVVYSGETLARAVGTQFDVYRKPKRTIVTVVEGEVSVSNVARSKSSGFAPGNPSSSSSSRPAKTGDDRSARTGHAVLLSAGEQVTVTERKVAAPHPVDIAVATAWTQKKLVFDSSPLTEVVEEFNRYNRRQLVLQDADLGDFHVTGMFPSTDSQRMIEFLEQRFTVTVTEDGDRILISRP